MNTASGLIGHNCSYKWNCIL